MQKNTIKYDLLLFLTSFIWGTAFVAQSKGMDHLGPLMAHPPELVPLTVLWFLMLPSNKKISVARQKKSNVSVSTVKALLSEAGLKRVQTGHTRNLR